MSWVTTFTLNSPGGISDFDLAESQQLQKAVAAIMQIDTHRVKVGLWQQGHAEAAVSRGVAIIWTALEEVGIDAQVESAFLGTDIDCTAQVHELELLRRALVNPATDPDGDQAAGQTRGQPDFSATCLPPRSK